MTRHGHTSGGKVSREWATWNRMRKRCGVAGPRQKHTTMQRGVPKYVKRGMAEEWKYDFSVFYEYLIDTIGLHPGEGWSIDRIDNEIGYFPGNVQWMQISEQRRQGGLVPHDIYIYSEAGRARLRESGHNTGKLRAAFGIRNANGQFAKEGS